MCRVSLPTGTQGQSVEQGGARYVQSVSCQHGSPVDTCVSCCAAAIHISVIHLGRMVMYFASNGHSRLNTLFLHTGTGSCK